jgi:hypothetical protein
VNIELDEIYTFKMNSGEELVAKVVSMQDNMVIIKDPVSIAPSPQGMGLIPSLFTADHDKNIVLNTNNVALYGMTEVAIRSKYIEATTGIATPTQKKVILG